MTISIHAKTTVRELAGRYPQCRDVFTQHQIDYCCGGSQSLEHAARNSGTDLSALLATLQEKLLVTPSPPAPGQRDWYAAPLSELVEHIVQVHHNYMKAAIPRINGLLRKVAPCGMVRAMGKCCPRLKNSFGHWMTTLAAT